MYIATHGLTLLLAATSPAAHDVMHLLLLYLACYTCLPIAA